MHAQTPTHGDPGIWFDRRARSPQHSLAAAFAPPASAALAQAQDLRGGTQNALTSALDAIDYGVVLADAEARVHYANQAALRRMASGSALRLADSVIRPRSREHESAFRGAIAAAIGGRRSMLHLPEAQAGLAVAFVPLVTETPTGSATALLLLGKGEPCESLSIEFFAQQHRLTPAESAVLRGLCSGQQPSEIARAAGVAISTVRTQIGSLRCKTQAASIGEMVRMVMLLPPMAPVLWRAM